MPGDAAYGLLPPPFHRRKDDRVFESGAIFLREHMENYDEANERLKEALDGFEAALHAVHTSDTWVDMAVNHIKYKAAVKKVHRARTHWFEERQRYEREHGFDVHTPLFTPPSTPPLDPLDEFMQDVPPPKYGTPSELAAPCMCAECCGGSPSFVDDDY